MVDGEPGAGSGQAGAATTGQDGVADDGTPDSGSTANAETGRYSLLYRSVRTSLGSDSLTLTAYGAVGTLLAVAVAVLVLLAFPGWVVESVTADRTDAFSRAFLLLLGLALLAPLFAPMLFADRRHRRGTASRRRDALYGLSGFLFVFGLYCSLLISAPPELRDPPPAAIAPVVEFLYALDPVYALVPPVAGVAAIVAADRI